MKNNIRMLKPWRNPKDKHIQICGYPIFVKGNNCYFCKKELKDRTIREKSKHANCMPLQSNFDKELSDWLHKRYPILYK